MKLNFIATLLTSFLCLPLLATTSVSECMDHARNYGDGLGKRPMPPLCPVVIKESAHSKLSRVVSPQMNHVFAQEGMLYSREDHKYLYAGNNTLLEELISLRQFEKEIFVLTKKNGVLVFLDFLPGNVTAIRRFQNTDTDFASDIEADTENLYLLVEDQIVIYDREANTLRRIENQRAEVKKKIDLPKTGAKAIALNSSKTHIYVLYTNNVLKIELQSGHYEVEEEGIELHNKEALDYNDHLIIK